MSKSNCRLPDFHLLYLGFSSKVTNSVTLQNITPQLSRICLATIKPTFPYSRLSWLSKHPRVKLHQRQRQRMSVGRSFGPMLVRWRAWELPQCDGSLHRFRRPPLPEPAGRRPSGLRPVLSCDSHKLVPTPDSFLSSFLIRWPAGALEWWKFDPVILLLEVEVGFLWSKANPFGLGAGQRISHHAVRHQFCFQQQPRGQPKHLDIPLLCIQNESLLKSSWQQWELLVEEEGHLQAGGRVHYWLMRQLCGRHKQSQTPLIIVWHWKSVFIPSW